MNTFHPNTLLITFPDMANISPHNNGRMDKSDKCYLKCTLLPQLILSNTAGPVNSGASQPTPHVRASGQLSANMPIR